MILVLLYIIFFAIFVTPQSETVKVTNITPSLFEQLRREHGETLSCLCTTPIVPYKNFVSITYSFHRVCTSIFVSEEWIKALYMTDASSHLIMDFRTTAHSQVSPYLLRMTVSVTKKTICWPALSSFSSSFLLLSVRSSKAQFSKRSSLSTTPNSLASKRHPKMKLSLK